MEDSILAIGLLIGLVNVVKMTFPKVEGLYAFLVQLAFGVLMGYLHWFGVTGIEQGVLYAFIASGTYKITKNFATIRQA